MLKITSLKERRTRGDLIQKFKIENNLDEIEWPFNPNFGQPRGGHRGYFFREIVKNCRHLLLTYFAGAFAPVATQLLLLLE